MLNLRKSHRKNKLQSNTFFVFFLSFEFHFEFFEIPINKFQGQSINQSFYYSVVCRFFHLHHLSPEIKRKTNVEKNIAKCAVLIYKFQFTTINNKYRNKYPVIIILLCYIKLKFKHNNLINWYFIKHDLPFISLTPPHIIVYILQ